ncbi:MAG: ChuX/HutX family heme-like substrate-binding protein, partial [Pseudomonadota bacterium]
MLDPDQGPTHQGIRDAVDALPQKTAMRPRDMAARVGVSEAELIAATAGPSGRQVAKRLHDDVLAIVKHLPSLGEVMALTRNQAAVHEKVGVYGELEGDGQVAGIYGENIDLRLFLRNWRFGFAFEETNPDSEQPKRSLQFFDARGEAVHKVHLRPESAHDAFEALVADMADDAWEDDLAVEPPLAIHPRQANDVSGLKIAWRELQNVHDFHLLLRRFEVGRLEALRCVGSEFAYETEPTAHRGLMETAA